jgi:hypothetical protein
MRMSEPEPTPGAEPSAALQAERRAFVRLASDLAATCRTSARSREVSWPGRVRDISRGGVGLLMQHRFRPGTRLAVELRGGTGVLLRTLSAVVAHARAVLVDGNHCWLLGCAFDEPIDDVELDALV